MANYNYSTACYMASKYGIQDVQLVQGKNPKQCTSIIYKGNKVSTSSMTKTELDTLFNHIACYGNVDGFVKSVARQKINNAWGYNMASMLANYEKQVRTYGDSFKTMIKLKDRSLSDVMIEYIQDGELDDTLNVENWKQSVVNFFTESEYDADGTLLYKVDYEKGLKKAKETITRLLENKEVHIMGNHVYSDWALNQLVKMWHGANDIQSTKENNKEIVLKFVERVQELCN